MKSSMVLCIAVCAAASLSGCRVTIPDTNLGSQWVVANDSNATTIVEVQWVPPAGEQGYMEPYVYELPPCTFETPSFPEGNYDVKVFLVATGKKVAQKRILIPANTGNRDFAYEEVRGHQPTMYHGGIVVSGEFPNNYHIKIES